MSQAAGRDAVADFLDAMRAAGIETDLTPATVQADGELHRVRETSKRKKNLNAWYIFHGDDPVSGAFGDWSQMSSHTWCAVDSRELTAEERKAIADRMEESKRRHAAKRDRLTAEAIAASKLIYGAAGKATADHPYLKRKGLAPLAGLRELRRDVVYSVDGEEKTAYAGCLVVPMFSAEGDLSGAQRILKDGAKYFVKGTPKRGLYHSIGKPREGNPIVIAEGYATGARIHIVTGFCVIVAFDSGNLRPVAEAIRAKFPSERIVIAADNDRFTKTDQIDNPGLTKAKDAAKAIKSLVSVPHFMESDPQDATDFDDLARLHGDDALRAAIGAAVEPASAAEWAPDPAPAEAPPPIEEIPDGPGEDDIPDFAPPPEPDAPNASPPPKVETREKKPDDHPLAHFGEPYFRCLGVDGEVMFYQPSNVAQVMALKLNQHSAAYLFRLAPAQWWEMEFPKGGNSGGFDQQAAVNACVQACVFKGKFSAQTAIRGRGAWFEGQTSVYHAGDVLYVDGKRVPISDHKTKYVYDEGAEIPVAMDSPATAAEARDFLSLCKSLRWRSPLSGYLLAGWCALAPVCGFLRWRPHIWLTGPSGAGKSTVIKRIINPTLDEVSHSVVGNTSEAGIRAALGMDALPLIFDESEPKDVQAQSRIRAILDLARVAASESEGRIMKGSQSHQAKAFHARFMAVFASINTQIEGYADESRFTQLALAAAENDTEEQRDANARHYDSLLREIAALITPDFPSRLMARTIHHLPRLRRLVDVFTLAASHHFGDQRQGDQLGPMLAGAWLLHTEKECDYDSAKKWIAKNDWRGHGASQAARDSERFLQHVAQYVVRNQTPEGGTWERPIADLVDIATGPEKRETYGEFGQRELVENKEHTAAVRALGRHGIAVRQDEAGEWLVDFSTTADTFKRQVLGRTEWAGTNLAQMWATIRESVPGTQRRYFAGGLRTPFVTLPLSRLLGDREPGEEG